MKKHLIILLAILAFGSSLYSQSNYLDPSFGNGGYSHPIISNIPYAGALSMLVQPDGKILIREESVLDINHYTTSVLIHRFLPDGGLDQNFGINGTTDLLMSDSIASGSVGHKLQLLPNGKIISGYQTSHLMDSLRTTLVRLTPDGSFDPAFGINGQVHFKDAFSFGYQAVLYDILVQNTGRIVLVYSSQYSGYADFGFRLLDNAGHIIPGYEEINWGVTENIDEFFSAAMLQADDKIIVGGITNPINGMSQGNDFVVARYNPFTYNDEDFGNNGTVQQDISGTSEFLVDMILQPDGKILACGHDYKDDIVILGLLPDGAINQDFGINGIADYPGLLATKACDRASDGKIVVAGVKYANPVNSNNEGAIARFLPNGSVDTTFTADGMVYLPFSEINSYTTFQDVTVLPDRRILVCGIAEDNSKHLILARFLPEADAVVWYRDLDADGYGNAADSVFAAELPLGYVANHGDCDDNNANVNPSAPEICGNGIDDNCDGISEIDTIAPIANCVEFIKLQLDSVGVISFDASQLNDGSTDNCAANLNFSVDKSVFDCSNLFLNMVTLTVTDPSGNSSTCPSLVKIGDQISPVMICQTSFELPLDNYGHATLEVGNINNGSYDNCAISAISIDKTFFNCSDLGANTVTLRAEDTYGNYSTCETPVHVVDLVAPVAVCAEMLTLALDSLGAAILEAEALDLGSYDACSANVGLAIDRALFHCEDLGSNTVALTVSDNYGNTNTCLTEVIIVDKTAPVAICTDSMIIEIDDTGLITLNAVFFDAGSYDNCAILGFQVSPQQLGTLNIGIVPVTLTVSDSSGNETACISMVEVKQNTSGVQELSTGLNIKVCPNPSTGLFELRMDADLVCERAQVFNTSGQLIWAETTSSSSLKFDLSSQAPGCYGLRVQSGDQVQVLKLVVVR